MGTRPAALKTLITSKTLVVCVREKTLIKCRHSTEIVGISGQYEALIRHQNGLVIMVSGCGIELFRVHR